MARRWTVAAVACLTTAMLAGCSGGTKQASTTLPTTSAPASAAASPTLPPLGPPDLPMPLEARQQTPSGVEAFTRYYLALINRTSRVMDAADLRALSAACETCNRIASDTDKDRQAGYHYESGEISIRSTAPATLDGASGQMAFLADQAPLTVIDGAGQKVQSLSAGEIKSISSGVIVRWDEGRRTWLMTQLTLG